MRSIVPNQDMQPYENVYRRQSDNENEYQGSSNQPMVDEQVEESPERNDEAFQDEASVEVEYEYDYAMSISELLYSTSSFYAIVVPG